MTGAAAYFMMVNPVGMFFFTGDFPAWFCLYWYGSQKGITF